MACGIAMNLPDIDWATVGAVVLLVARLCKDVPDAYDAIVERIRVYREKKKQTNGKSN